MSGETSTEVAIKPLDGSLGIGRGFIDSVCHFGTSEDEEVAKLLLLIGERSSRPDVEDNRSYINYFTIPGEFSSRVIALTVRAMTRNMRWQEIVALKQQSQVSFALAAANIHFDNYTPLKSLEGWYEWFKLAIDLEQQVPKELIAYDKINDAFKHAAF